MSFHVTAGELAAGDRYGHRHPDGPLCVPAWCGSGRPAEPGPNAGNRAKLEWLSACAAADATEASRRGDTEGSFYARGARDAYATAAVFWAGD